MLINKLFNKDPSIVPEETTLIILSRKSYVFMYKNVKDTKHTRHIDRRVHFVRKGEKCKFAQY